MSDTLFVYGTLKRQRAGKPHRLLRRARFVSGASVGGALYDLGRYPGLVRKTHNGDRVFGELYELPEDSAPAMLRILDHHEGGEFDRRRVYVRFPDGQRRAAWAYVLRESPPQSARQVRSGRYPLRRGAA